jgi:hypothetical protein
MVRHKVYDAEPAASGRFVTRETSALPGSGQGLLQVSSSWVDRDTGATQLI